MSIRSTLRVAFALLALVVWLPAGRAQQLSPNPLDALKWRHIGPVGNRVAAVAGVPGDPSVYYAGAASGGLWKTTDGGTYWEPLFDGQSAQSIGAALGLQSTAVTIAGAVLCFGLRFIAIRRGWHLPVADEPEPSTKKAHAPKDRKDDGARRR